MCAGAIAGAKRAFFKNVKRIPAVRRKVDEEMKKTQENMSEEMGSLFQGNKGEAHFITKIPCEGLEIDDILTKVTEYLELG